MSSYEAEEKQDLFRIKIDSEELEVALASFCALDAFEAPAVPDLTSEQQADLFRDFVKNVLTRMAVPEGRTHWPDQMWASVAGINESRRGFGLREVQLSLSTQRVYFWGCEIGHLVRTGRLTYHFDPVEHRAVPPDMQHDDPDIRG